MGSNQIPTAVHSQDDPAAEARVARMTADLLEVADNGTFTADKAVVRAVALRWIAMNVERRGCTAEEAVRDTVEVLAATDQAMAALAERYGDLAAPVAPLLAGAAVTP